MKKIIPVMLGLLISLAAMGQTPGYSAAMIQSHGEEWSAGKTWDYVSGLVAKTILMYCGQYPDDGLSAQAYGWQQERHAPFLHLMSVDI